MMDMETMDLLAAKKNLRKELRSLRSAVPAKERQLFSARMTAELSRQYFFQDANVVMAYASLLEEVQLYDLLRFSLDIGKKVCIPYIHGDGLMDAAELASLGDLVEARYSILTVRDAQERIVDPASIGCVIVPGVAFTAAGERLGMGGGHYDRFLKEQAPYAYRVALAFECQMVDHVPTEPHDLLMDTIITEERTIHCKESR